jgi:hypothetical protein
MKKKDNISPSSPLSDVTREGVMILAIRTAHCSLNAAVTADCRTVASYRYESQRTKQGNSKKKLSLMLYDVRI